MLTGATTPASLENEPTGIPKEIRNEDHKQVSRKGRNLRV